MDWWDLAPRVPRHTRLISATEVAEGPQLHRVLCTFPFYYTTLYYKPRFVTRSSCDSNPPNKTEVRARCDCTTAFAVAFPFAGDLPMTSGAIPRLQLLMQAGRCAVAGPGFVAHRYYVAVRWHGPRLCLYPPIYLSIRAAAAKPTLPETWEMRRAVRGKCFLLFFNVWDLSVMLGGHYGHSGIQLLIQAERCAVAGSEGPVGHGACGCGLGWNGP